MKKFAFALIGLALIPAFAQVQTMVNPIERLAQIVYDNFVSGKEDHELRASLVQLISVQVTQDLIQEADALKLNVPKYLETSDSLDKFFELTKESTSNLNNKSQAFSIVALLKIGIRLNMQENVRFPPSNYFAKTAEIRALIPLLEQKLQFFVDPKEDHLNAVIENLKKDATLMEGMKAAAKSRLCPQGDAVNPFARAVASALAKGGTFKVGNRSVQIPASRDWGVLSKDTQNGGEQNVQDVVAYRNPDGSLSVYDVVFDACGENVKVQINNFTRVNVENPTRLHFQSITSPARGENQRQRNPGRGGGQP